MSEDLKIRIEELLKEYDGTKKTINPAMRDFFLSVSTELLREILNNAE